MDESVSMAAAEGEIRRAEMLWRLEILSIATKIPQQGGTFWETVEKVENYLKTGSPT